MAHLTISQAADQLRLRPSTIRFYEEIGLLVPAPRISGQRRYDQSALHRLALIRRAVQAGFTLDEIRHLFYGFRRTASASERWQKLAQSKLAELEQQLAEIREMQALLVRLQDCRCGALQECGEKIFRRLCTPPPRADAPKRRIPKRGSRMQ